MFENLRDEKPARFPVVISLLYLLSFYFSAFRERQVISTIFDSLTCSRSAMSLEEIHKRRLAANGILKNTFWAAKELDHAHLSPDDLEKLNVQLSYFNIRGDGGGRAVNSGIQFFDPKPQHNMEILPDWTVNFHTPVDDGPTYDATTTESYGNFFKRYLSRPVDKPLIDFGPWGKVGYVCPKA